MLAASTKPLDKNYRTENSDVSSFWKDQKSQDGASSFAPHDQGSIGEDDDPLSGLEASAINFQNEDDEAKEMKGSRFKVKKTGALEKDLKRVLEDNEQLKKQLEEVKQQKKEL